MTEAPSLPPLHTFRHLFNYDPLTGAITYTQQRGPRAAGDAAGYVQHGRMYLLIAGRRCRAPAVVWALQHDADPAPLHVSPVNGDPLDLRLSNLTLTAEPFARPQPPPGARCRRPTWQRTQIRYNVYTGLWDAFYRHLRAKQLTCIGAFESKADAIAARRAYAAQHAPQGRQGEGEGESAA